MPPPSRPLCEPILDFQSSYATKLPFVACHNNHAQRHGLRSNQKIVATDKHPRCFMRGSDVAISHVDLRLEGQHINDAQDCFQLLGQPREPFFAAPYRSSAATIMLVAIASSPTSAIFTAARP